MSTARVQLLADVQALRDARAARDLGVPPLPDVHRLRAFTMRELAAHRFADRRTLLSRAGTPILRAGHLAQVFAPRGTGKSWYLRTLALIAATGTDGLGFSAPDPCRVLEIDGEMDGREIQERDRVLGDAINVLPTDNLITIAADWQDDYLPRLDTVAGQELVEPFVADADLVILDNRSCLFDPESEKDPTAWTPAQDWLLSLRRRGKAVIVAHHTNRQGGARGHSRPEDVMNLLVKLVRPDDYHADQGARFRVEFEKCRGAYGAAVAASTMQLTAGGWLLEEDHPHATNSTVQKLREYVRAASAAGDRPKSASAAIRAAGVNKQKGLEAWAALLRNADISKHDDGGFHAD
jgi:AAA domain